jgi:superfamily I DNA/RNA helicase
MDENFDAVEIELRKGFIAVEPDLAFFTEDNSFPMFLKDFMEKLLNNIKEAMLDKEATEFKEVQNYFKRFFQTIFNAINFRLLDYRSISFLTNFSLLINNWLLMVQQGNLLSFFGLSEEDIDRLKASSKDLGEIITLNLDVENLHNLTNRLIKKAELILASTPSNFKISEHFFNVLKKETSE